MHVLFANNCFIEFLDLSNNRLCDQGFKLLLNALLNNATVLVLNLENTEITSKSDEAIH